MSVGLVYAYRNEEYQEVLWRMSFDYLKDHLSPEAVEKYGPKPEPSAQLAAEPESNETPADGQEEAAMVCSDEKSAEKTFRDGQKRKEGEESDAPAAS